MLSAGSCCARHLEGASDPETPGENNREAESERIVPMSPEPPDPSLPGRLREFHARLPLAGDPPNALLALPDDRLLYLAALLRVTPQPAPALSRHGVFSLKD